MNLSKISIERPVFAWMLMASLILFGLISFKQLGISELPDVDFPTVNVGVQLDGASPEIMESDVVDVIENALMGVEGLKDISSSVRYGTGNITLEFNLSRNVDVALQEVQSKLAQLGGRLPKNINPPIVSKSNPEDQPILWLALSGDSTPRDLMIYARDKIIPQLQLVPGVGEVFFGGYLEPNIRVWINPKLLAKYELSVDDIVAAIGSEHVELPAGILERKDREYVLRVIGEAKTVQELGRIVIAKRGGAPIYSPLRLGDVARVESGLEDVRRKVRAMGENAIGMGIRKQRGTNAVEIADGIFAKMESLKSSLPEKLRLGVNFDSTKFIRETVHELEFELILSGLLTAIVCLFFLGSWSATFNVLMAIPTSIIGALIAIKFFGFTLNTFTFLGLTLAVGIVVDDAIMVLENIFRHRDMGKSRFQAALDGAKQIQFAALATTLAIIAIFLPIAFMDGVIGKFFLQFGITISLAVAISLLEALTLTPMRCSQFMEEHHKEGRFVDRWMDRLSVIYGKTLHWTLDHKALFLGGGVVLFVMSAFLLKVIKKEFIPVQDQGLFIIRMQTPVGSSIDFTDRLVKEVENRLGQVPEISRYFVSIGGGGNNGGQVNTAMSFVTLTPRSERKLSQQEVMAKVRMSLKEINGLRIVLQDLSARSFGGGRGFPIEFSIRGPDWEQLIKLARDFEKKFKADPRFMDVDTNLDEGSSELSIVPKRNQAGELGVSINNIANAVSFLVGGERVARFTESGKRIDVRVKVDRPYINDFKTILDLKVRNNRGELIRLGDVAEVQEKTSLASITRQQRERSITIYSNISPKSSQAELISTIEEERKNLPQGYSLILSGSSKTFGESFSSLSFALWLGLIVAYMILGSQFNSFIHGFTVLLALPFSLSGAWLALWVSEKSLNVYSMIGLILLMGIAKKNSIMLVDFSNQLRDDEGLSAREALLKACPLRLRPILMTSITIIVAALPAMMELGPGAETRSPMAAAIVGGTLVSTLLTLFIVPCVYLLLSRLQKKAPVKI
ncbi:MAG: efflux RND transporter permease subunit [Bdellovibrionales bacterium]|nr:efflux RND transporter permease subunit [Bdellovibrionales bacterium]